MQVRRVTSKNTGPECICGNASSNYCGKCGLPYCSAECQRFDWPVHRNFCGATTPAYERVLNGEMLVPEILPPGEPNVRFSWKPVEGIVGYLERQDGKAAMEFVTVWAKLPDMTVHLDVMTRYGVPRIIIQWERGGKVWTHDPEMGREVFQRQSLEECDTHELKVVGIPR